MKGIFIPDITSEMFRNGCLEGIEALMAEGEIYDIECDPSAQRWIPCSERLPEKDGEYLTTTEDGLCDVESYGDGEWFYDDVVAWAPLPKPWKGDAP